MTQLLRHLQRDHAHETVLDKASSFTHYVMDFYKLGDFYLDLTLPDEAVVGSPSDGLRCHLAKVKPPTHRYVMPYTLIKDQRLIQQSLVYMWIKTC